LQNLASFVTFAKIMATIPFVSRLTEPLTVSGVFSEFVGKINQFGEPYYDVYIRFDNRSSRLFQVWHDSLAFKQLTPTSMMIDFFV
jgi:hypothetical protein